MIAKLKYRFMMQRLGRRLYCCLMFYNFWSSVPFGTFSI